MACPPFDNFKISTNFGPLPRGIVTNPILIIEFDTYLTPKVTRILGLSQGTSDSEYSALTHFSMRLARQYANLKEPYSQEIKE